MKTNFFFLKLTLLILVLGLSKISWTQNTILWEVKHADNEEPSYLLGTFHQIGNSFVDSLPKIKELLYASDIAFFESIDPVDSLRAMLNRRPESSKWRKELRKSDVQFLVNHSKDWSVSIDKLTPVELYIKLNQDYILYTCGTSRPDDEWNHFDNYLTHLAKENGIKIKGLETDSIQTIDINAMAHDYDWKKAKRDIKGIVRDIKKSKTNTNRCKFAQEYMSFKLDYQFNEDCGNPNMIRRNNLWMPVLLEHLKTDKIFVTVGLLHLYGKCGLIEQLRQKGYTVEPIIIEKKTSP